MTHGDLTNFFFRNYKIWVVTLQHSVLRVQQATICFIGKRRLWVRQKVLTRVASFSSPSTSPRTTPSSRPKWHLPPGSIILTLTPTGASAQISSDPSGHQHSQSQRVKLSIIQKELKIEEKFREFHAFHEILRFFQLF